jgi:type I restriction enzyme, R subunit
MTRNTYQFSLDFEQILTIVKQLPEAEKEKLKQELDAVRQLIHHAKSHGSGRNYLIQHSAGSGKSNSIAWLAYRLSTLHDERDGKIFHSVIVITDRTILARQLQNTIYQFEHIVISIKIETVKTRPNKGFSGRGCLILTRNDYKAGVVQKIDEDTQQLAKALADGVPIIISTIQKFGFITRAIATLAKKGENIAGDRREKFFRMDLRSGASQLCNEYKYSGREEGFCRNDSGSNHTMCENL